MDFTLFSVGSGCVKVPAHKISRVIFPGFSAVVYVIIVSIMVIGCIIVLRLYCMVCIL